MLASPSVQMMHFDPGLEDAITTLVTSAGPRAVEPATRS